MDERIAALTRAVSAAPDDGPLRLLLAEALAAGGLVDDALTAYGELAERDLLPAGAAVQAGTLAAEHGRPQAAATMLAAARRGGAVDGIAALAARVDALLADAGVTPLRARDAPGAREAPAAATFADVGGMSEVKQVLHRRIVLPISRPEIYAAYGRSAGGGVLLYGPPGCGKTLLARATAGECGLPLVGVRIEDIVDPYQGVSERNLHAAFERARAQAPCMLFIDELDAIGFARSRASGPLTRRLTDVLLQELDAVGTTGDGVLALAATNTPWDVDEALLRPGRFDRAIFVPPPDEAARAAVLGIALRDVPSAGIDVAAAAAATPLFSGADLRSVVEHAIDQVIEEALTAGTPPPVLPAHLDAAIAATRPTTLDWLRRAAAYVQYANQAERYNDVATYLATRDVRRRLTR